MSLPTINTSDMGGSASLTLVQTKSAFKGSLVVMDCGDFSLCIPSQDAVSVVSCKELVVLPQWEESCGYVDVMEQRYPVFCITKSLQLQKTIAQEHHVIVLLSAQQYFFAISCRAISKIESAQLQIFSVPVAMRSRKQPFSEFAIVDDRAVGLTSAAHVLAFLQLRGAKLAFQDEGAISVQGVI